MAAEGGDGATELFALWEAFRAEHPDRVSRQQIGTDESEAYPIWIYTIAPRREMRRKVFVNAGTHGGEVTGMIGVLRALRQLVGEEAPNDERARWVNDYCVLFVSPCLNPWGTSQSPRARPNANGVDLNRNFDFAIGDETGVNDKWSEFVNDPDPDYGTKGTAPLSESETTAIMAFLDGHDDLYRAVDVHGFVGVGDGTRDSLIYNPVWYGRSNRIGWRRVALAFTDTDSRASTADTAEYPSMDNSLFTRGVECVTAEYVPLAGESLFDAASMTRNVAFHGNVILELAYGRRAREIIPAQTAGRVYSLPFLDGGLPSEAGEIVPVDTFSFMTPGVLLATGNLFVSASTGDDTRFYFRPLIGQDGSIPGGFRYSQQSFNVLLQHDVRANKRATMPFQFMMPVRAGNLVRVSFELWVDLAVNNAILRGGSMNLLFLPSDVGGDVFKHFAYNAVQDEWRERAPAVYPLLS